MLIRQPTARLLKVHMQVSHHQVDGTYRLRHAHKASTSVLTYPIRHTWVTVVMKRAEAFMPLNP